MHDLTKEIIRKWGNPNQNPDSYIFGLVKPEMTPFEIQQKVNKQKNISNILLSRIGRRLGFNVHLCLNLARHSFATTLKTNSTSVAAISDAMGHSNTTVTEHYMKSLPNENLKIMSNSLLAF
jgi:site-specific recombinase XerD